MLNGAGSSYYGGFETSTPLHTDICSPVATDPKWTDLDKSTQEALQKDGVPLWHLLLKAIRPDVVVLSFQECLRECISFDPFLAPLLHASFRPRLATTPLRFADPSPPSG